MERRVIVSAALAHATTHGLELAFAALLVRIGLEFGADLAVLGAVANAGTFTFGATALPSGLLVDRFGPRAVMVTSLGAASACALLVAAAPSLPLLAVALAILGAAIGLYHPAGISLVATVSRRRGMALASHGIAGNVGVALAPAAAIALAIAFDWRVAYIAFAAVAAVVATLVMRIAPDRDEAAAAVAERARAVRADPAARQRSTPPAERRWLARPLLIVYAIAIGQGFIYRGSLTFLPVHFREHLELTVFGWNAEAVAGATTAVVLLAAIFGQIAGGTLSDRIPVEQAAVPFALLTVPFLVLMAPATGLVLIAAAAGFALMHWALQPIVNGLITDYAPEGAAGQAFGIAFFLTFGVGSFAGSFAGLIAERWGTPTMFYALAVIAFAMLIGAWVLRTGARQRAALRREGLELEVAGG